MVKQHLHRTITDRLYHCLVCQVGAALLGNILVFQDSEWSSPKMDVAREHVYDHFGVYLFQCDLCLDLFRKQAHYTRHREIHSKREEEREVQEGDKLGGYHLLEQPVFLAWKVAKPVIDTYYSREEGRASCKLCSHSSTTGPLMRTHLLQEHLKLRVWRCPECGLEVGPEPAIRRHLQEEHGQEWEGLERVDDPEYESAETEVDCAPEEMGSLPLEQVAGRKVSSAQGRALRKCGVTRLESAGCYECQYCDHRREHMAQLCDHVMTAHYDVYIYRCPVEGCGKLLRNWSRYTTHRSTHGRTRAAPAPRARRKHWREESGGPEEGHHLLQEDTFVGKEEGLRIARGYFQYSEEAGRYQCKLCEYRGRHQTVEQHVLAIHLRRLYLFRCEICGKQFRYSENAFKDHVSLHSEGKLPCHLCQALDQGGEKRFTKASLAAHLRRIHREGSFPCRVEGCGASLGTLAELRSHERQEHQAGLPARSLQYMCELCQHTFPRKQQLDGHLESCQAGRSRSRFRKMIADCLTWQGDGVYQCNFCQETFAPPRPTASSLPLARRHVVSVHKMHHLRKAKMSWTQGVEGLNMKKKAERKDQAREGVQVWVEGEEGVVGEEVVQQVEGEEVVLEQLYLVPDDITQEVEVNTVEMEEQEEVEPKIRVINTYFKT